MPLRWLWLAVLLLITANCAARADAITPAMQAVASAQSQFGFDLLHELEQAQPGKNIFISPASIHLALSMASIGASGPTKTGMTRALRLQGIDDATLDAGNRELAQDLTQGDSATGTLQIANGLFAAKDLQIRPEFVSDCCRSYDAVVEALDFRSPAAARTIDAWLRERTGGKITSIGPIAPATRICLIDAVHFKARWQEPFPASETYDHSFATGPHAVVNVKMMRASRLWSYAETGRYQAVRIGYAGQQYSLMVVLPRPGAALTDFIAGLDPPAWRQIAAQMTTRLGDVELPRVRIAWSGMLNQPLTDMGMGIAFSRDADFSRMARERASLTAVIHKTYLSIDEQGTEAAALTALTLSRSAVRRPLRPPFQMVVDRPFLCAIVDRATGDILFLGAICDPLG